MQRIFRFLALPQPSAIVATSNDRSLSFQADALTIFMLAALAHTYRRPFSSIVCVGLRPAVGHVWTTPALQEESDGACGRVQVMCPACLRGTMTAGPDVVRGSVPSFARALTPMTQKRVVPIDGSTVSHHAVITLAIRMSCSAVASGSYCQASSGGCSKLRRSIVSSLGHDRPSDARHPVGNGNSDEFGRLLGQQPHDPGMLLRLLPGVSNNGCCTDDEQSSEIAISLLGDAAERSLPPVECCRGTSPIHVAKSRPDLKSLGSVTVEAMAVPPITPIPGTVSRRQPMSLARCWV